MKVIQLSPNSLIPHPNNPRIISDHSFQGLKESIKMFGFQQPVVINSKNEILSGNQRTKAAIELGIEKIPCVKVKFASDIEEKCFLITMNNKAIEGDFTEEVNSIIDEIRLELGNDFVFDLNLEDVLAQLNEVGEDEDEIADTGNEKKGRELDEGDFSEFNCKCPRCSFEFNK